MSVLAIRDLTVAYGGLVAVDGVSLRVEAGEIVGLIGPNGAGKTSLFEAACGFVTPRAGAVELNGVDVTRWPPERRAAHGLARTFQRLELFGHLSVFDNLLVAAESRLLESGLAADVLGLRKASRPCLAVAERVVERLELGPVARRRAGELPPGIGRLVELGRALCTDPRVVLLDEPTAGLDERETDRVAAVLRSLVDEGGPALLLVEHDVSFVSGLADRVYVMEFGKMIAEGDPARVCRDERVRRAYLGTEEESDAGAAGRRQR